MRCMLYEFPLLLLAVGPMSGGDCFVAVYDLWVPVSSEHVFHTRFVYDGSLAGIRRILFGDLEFNSFGSMCLCG